MLPPKQEQVPNEAESIEPRERRVKAETAQILREDGWPEWLIAYHIGLEPSILAAIVAQDNKEQDAFARRLQMRIP